MPSLIDSLAKNIFQKAIVVEKQRIAAHVYRIRIQSDSLKVYAHVPGDHLRLFVGIGRDTALNSKLRTYSVWDHDRASGTIDIAVCMHSAGIGATWAEKVEIGEDIHYMGPKGKLTIDTNAESSLMICDPSGLSHMYAIHRQISAGKKNYGVVYAADPSDYYADIDGSKPFSFFRLEYDPMRKLIEAANALKDSLSERPTIYLGGDARVCKSMGRYFMENWPNAAVRSRGFWMPGKTGMD